MRDNECLLEECEPVAAVTDRDLETARVILISTVFNTVTSIMWLSRGRLYPYVEAKPTNSTSLALKAAKDVRLLPNRRSRAGCCALGVHPNLTSDSAAEPV